MDNTCQCGRLSLFLQSLQLGMGACLCKEKRRRRRTDDSESASSGPELRRSDSSSRRRFRRRRSFDLIDTNDDQSGAISGTQWKTIESDIRELIRQTLRVIRTLVNNEQEPPTSLLKLNLLADKENGWIIVVKALIDTVPDEDSLGPAVITLFLDECPLPSRDTVHRLLYSLNLPERINDDPGWNKNACIVLGSLAEKLAGSSSVGMCTQKTLGYLINNLAPHNPKQVILFSLLALEKFAQTSENQNMIVRNFESREEHPLEVLEKWLHEPSLRNDWLAHQVAFCSQWSLDNIFVHSNRVYAYETTDVSKINAMLNHEDVSEYLKIGPNGLEARCDVSSFESVRCTFEVLEGAWFYEATVLTPGVMQIGFATKRSLFLNHEGYGIGDDESSVAYDGCRQLLWHNAKCSRHEHPPWEAGDVVGCLLDLTNEFILFYHNGVPLQRPHLEFLARRPQNDGVFAAASFMSFQQCRFNFGASEFKYPPAIPFRTFNVGGSPLSLSQKTILPRRRRLELLQREPIPEDYCTICFANPGNTVLRPCEHSGFCGDCAMQMEQCPLCRSTIESRLTF
ncbi:unnamed protein product [Auanema sp. JU1783]|nr:unnamed protein product [Auanema sp. JU1783]